MCNLCKFNATKQKKKQTNWVMYFLLKFYFIFYKLNFPLKFMYLKNYYKKNVKCYGFLK